jgi:hypothetical protein
MKQNRMTKLLATGAVSAIALTTAFAQTSSTTTTTTNPATAVTSNSSTTTTSTSTVDGTGTITTYKPGLDYITVRTETSTTPIMYYYTKGTTVVDSEGKTVEMSMLKSDMPVKYTYATEGDRLVVRKITLTKPLSSYETKETTTTTTTKP